MSIRLRRLQQAGDTIVEVMVVLAILGLALGISYATANRSLQSTSAAQENSQATALLQAQIEALRFLAPTATPAPGQDVFNQPAPFCVDTSGMLIKPQTDPVCTNGLYKIAITAQPDTDKTVPTTSGATFILTATWDDIHGDGMDSVTLSYKLSQGAN